MAKTTIEVDLVVKGGDSVGQVEGKVVSLKQQLKNLKAELASGNLTGKAFDDAAKKAGELQDRIGDVSTRVKNLASDSQKLDGFVSIAQGMVGGFAAVQGITALVGDENEELQKTMVKLQASMTALNGIQAVANTLNKDSAAMTALTTLKTGAQAVANRFLTATTLETTAATYALRAALIASGIGAIVVLLASAASAMGLFGETTDDTTESLKRQAEAKEKLNSAFKEGDDRDIARYKQEADLAKARVKLRGGTEAELLEIDRKFLVVKNARLKQQSEDDQVTEKQRLDAKANLLAGQNELELKNLEILQAQKDAKQDKLDKQSKAKAESKDVKKKTNNSLQQKMDEEVAEDEKLAEYKLKVAQDEIADEKEKQDELTRVAKQADDDRIKAYIESVQAKEAIAKSSFDILTNLGELALGQQFKQTAIGKTLAIAQIATDTALAISALVRNSEANPLNAPTSGLAGIAQFTAGIARITANVVKAKSILSGGGVGGSGGSGGGGQQQNSNPPSITGFTRGTDSQGNPITKVVVLEKDITNSQMRVARIRTNAELI